MPNSTHPTVLASVARLSDLEPGDSARVEAIVPTCEGLQRRRLLDLGILPGTLITVELASPAGDPLAYRVRGALIALRREQARAVLVTRSMSEGRPPDAE